jgi:hypothetical protein
VGLNVYRVPSGNLCVAFAREGPLSCEFLPRLGHGIIRLAYAHWLCRETTCRRFGIIVVGAIGPRVASVRVLLGAGRRVYATILVLPSELEVPFRLFYTEKWTRFESLNRRLAIVALDDHGRQIGRTPYLVQGG